MNIDIRSLYDLENGHIIFPYELIANSKLPNYEHVKFSSTPNGLVVECLCVMEDNKKIIFNYYFDEQDRLQKLVATDGGNHDVLFDRRSEIEKMRRSLNVLVK